MQDGASITVMGRGFSGGLDDGEDGQGFGGGDSASAEEGAGGGYGGMGGDGAACTSS